VCSDAEKVAAGVLFGVYVSQLITNLGVLALKAEPEVKLAALFSLLLHAMSAIYFLLPDKRLKTVSAAVTTFSLAVALATYPALGAVDVAKALLATSCASILSHAVLFLLLFDECPWASGGGAL